MTLSGYRVTSVHICFARRGHRSARVAVHTAFANLLWGAPRIHGELLKLGINVGQTTVAAGLRCYAAACVGEQGMAALAPVRWTIRKNLAVTRIE